MVVVIVGYFVGLVVCDFDVEVVYFVVFDM